MSFFTGTCPKRSRTNQSAFLAAEAFEEGGETPGGHVKELPAPSHGGPLRAEGGRVLAFVGMPEPVPKEDDEVGGVCEGGAEVGECAHGSSAMEASMMATVG